MNKEIQQTLNRLEWLCAKLPELLEKLSEEEFSKRPAPHNWSKKKFWGI